MVPCHVAAQKFFPWSSSADLSVRVRRLHVHVGHVEIVTLGGKTVVRHRPGISEALKLRSIARVGMRRRHRGEHEDQGEAENR